ncbi:hypothetical protein KCV03_g10397, partial [Aureobasidium melanogenum]
MDYWEQAHLFLRKALQSSWDVVTKFDASVHNYDAIFPSVLASELDNATGLTTIGQLKVPGYNEAGAQRLEASWGMVCGLDVNDRA